MNSLKPNERSSSRFNSASRPVLASPIGVDGREDRPEPAEMASLFGCKPTSVAKARSSVSTCFPPALMRL